MPRFQVMPVKPSRRKRYPGGHLTKTPSKAKAKLRILPAVIDLVPAGPILDTRGTGAVTAGAMVGIIEAIKPVDIPIVEEDLGEASGPAPIPTVVTCPLCKKEITFNDGIFNAKVIELNGNGIQIHKVCPE